MFLFTNYSLLLLLFSHPVMSDSATPRTAAWQASLPLTISQSLPKFMSTAPVMSSSQLILWHSSSDPQSFLPSGNLPMSQLFASDIMSFAWSTVTKNPPANAGDSGDTGSILVPRWCLGRGHGDLLQYSWLENPMDRGAKVATVHGISESDTDEHKPWHMQQLFDNKHTISWFSSLWSLS